LIERMRTDNVLFEKYRKNYYRRSKFDGIGDCDEKCKNGWLCSARQMHHSKALCADLNCKLHITHVIYSLDASLFTKKPSSILSSH
uniref:Thyroglobulin type-1 domain-containing protein n=1 Tax=Angiostrongylus cantonensis TaxID=6313 RepID=A0A0K0D569_ANGCA